MRGCTSFLRSLQLLTFCGQFCCYSFMLYLRPLQSSKRMLLKTLDSCILMCCVLKSVTIWYEEKGKNMYRSCQNQTSLVAQMVKNLPAMQETWVGKIPWRRERLPTPVFWPGEFHRQRNLAGYSPWGRKESDTTE